ncbi:sulfotransferase [Hanstruepera ponticola]|uniref:sulfotransferase n=1 Tax=Hanstruepera ponticola TaxID=2042995 RepID=UPI000CF14B3A|nr:sulfotransferase [Hanstruepera ponticola]
MKNYKNIQQPIIFIGSGRTGTTIIYELVCRHPSLAYPSNYQQKFYKYPVINLARNIFDNKLWRKFGQKKQLNKTGFLNKYHFIPGENFGMWNYLTGEDIDFSRDFLLDTKISQERIDFIRNYFSKMVAYQNKERLVMKINGAPRISFLLQLFPDAIIISLKRNKIPTLNSFLKVNFWKKRGYNKLWWYGAYSDKELEFAESIKTDPALITVFQLCKIDQVAEMEVRKLKPKYSEIHYEEFVENPLQTLNKIINVGNLKEYDFSNDLKEIKVYNQNKKDTEYFSNEKLVEINKIIKNFSS